MKLIDKDTLVAEIERRIKAIPRGEADKRLKAVYAAVYGNEAFVLMCLLSFINKLEVKEVPEWKPAAIAYKKDRLPRYDSALKRIVDRDEDGCYFLTMDDLYKLPKAQKGENI